VTRATPPNSAVRQSFASAVEAEQGTARSRGVGSSSVILTVALCFMAVLLDGLDTSSIGVAGPAIAAHFGVSAAALTAPFVMTSVGAVLGYLASGPLVARWGARRVLLASVFAFGILSLLTPQAGSIAQLSVLRLVTAIGLGAALPSAIAISLAHCPSRLKEAVTVIVAAGLAGGGILGGVVGGVLTSRYGWQCLFYVGGTLPLALLLPLALWLPALPSVTRGPALDGASGKRQALGLIKRLFAQGRAIHTASLWAFSFLIFAVAYAMVFWLPTWIVEFGFSREYAQFSVSFFSAGGLVASIAVILLVSRFAISRVMLAAGCLAALCLAGISMHEAGPAGAWIAIAGAGAGLIACSVGQSALAVSIYPEFLRTTGVGFSAAAGRVGSIVGPAVAGLFVSLGLGAKSIVLAAVLPISVAVAVLLLIAVPGRTVTEPEETSAR
jgi:MFS transporter, AAHS family, 4-hydroxybenzoate transporter